MHASARGRVRFRPKTVRLRTRSKAVIALSGLVGMERIRRQPRDCCQVGKLGSICLCVATRRATGRLGLDKRIGRLVNRLRRGVPPNCRMRVDCSTARCVRGRLSGVCFHAKLAMLVLLLFMTLVAQGLHCLFLVIADLTIGVSITIVLCCTFNLRVRLCSLTNVAVSLGLIVSGAVIVASRVLRHHGLGTFISMLTTALAAVKTLIVVFFLSRGVHLGLRSFTTIIVVGLTMSLFITLFFIPSVVSGVNLRGGGEEGEEHFLLEPAFVGQLAICFAHFCRKIVCCLYHFEIVTYLLLLLKFNLPMFVLPRGVRKRNG